MAKSDFGLPDDYSFVLEREKAPVRKVSCGETFTVSTRDAVNGQIPSEDVPFTSDTLVPMSLYKPELSNPVYGPVFIDGVRRGDLVAISILDIRVAPTGVTGIKVGQGIFHDSKKWMGIFESPCTKILRNSHEKGTVEFSSEVSWKLNPFIGTIGLAPEIEVHASSIVQTPFGGNWDCRHICKGSRLLVNAQVDGALLYVGDVHGSQGDGELTGIANEIEAEVDLSVDVVSQSTIPYARIETETHFVCIFSAKPLESAVQGAIDSMLQWMGELTTVNPRDLLMIFSTSSAFTIEVYQMVDMPGILFTAGVKLPKSLLPLR